MAKTCLQNRKANSLEPCNPKKAGWHEDKIQKINKSRLQATQDISSWLGESVGLRSRLYFHRAWDELPSTCRNLGENDLSHSGEEWERTAKTISWWTGYIQVKIKGEPEETLN